MAIFYSFNYTNKEKEPVIKQCSLYNCLDMVQYADTKNGIDLALVENFLTFICYGRNTLWKMAYISKQQASRLDRMGVIGNL